MQFSRVRRESLFSEGKRERGSEEREKKKAGSESDEHSAI